MLAQSLVEYGLLEAMKTSAQQLSLSLRAWAATATPTTWMIIAGVAVVLLWFWSRRS